MPREPFPEQPFNSHYSFLDRNQELLPPQLPPISVPPSRPFLEALDSSIPLTALRTCPYPVIQDIETLNGVNINRPFKTSTVIPDQWIEDYTSAYNDHQGTVQAEFVIYPPDIVFEGDTREVSKITQELFASLSEVVASTQEDSSEFVTKEEEVSLTGGVLSAFFISHLTQILNIESRKIGLQQLQNALSVFTYAVASFNLNCMTSEERSRVTKLLKRCVNFQKALSWALDDLRSKAQKNYSELRILKCIKVIFTLVLSFYYRERGYCMDVSETSERSYNRSGPDVEPIPAGLDLDAVLHNSDHSSCQHGKHSFQTTSSGIYAPFYQYQDIIDDSNLSANHYDEFIAQEEQVFLERRLPSSTDDALVTMFHSHVVPMTPVIARNNGRYVRGTQRTELSIMNAAYAYDTASGGCVIPCEFVLNRTYTPENNNSTQCPRYLTYVGFVYPDNTMLSYIPIKNVRIVYEDIPNRQPILQSGSTTFAFLHMDLPNSVYHNLKILAKEVYLRKDPNMLFVDHFEELLLDGHMVRIEVLVKSERTVRIEDRGRYLDYPVLQALFQCRHDLCGKSLMHLRFTSTKRGSRRMQLRLILFGITVERSPFNYHDRIFELLNSPPGPIQASLPIPLMLL